ncbi:hypothetical protein I4U23_012958 [Adineta vaga]|nr:hypothetical protein I4U23_012958 [Adineta vaga]
MAFRFRIPNIAFRKRMSWFDFTVACVIGVIAGVYTFKPGLQQAKEAIERREALKEIQARRQAEAERDKMIGTHPSPIINQHKPETTHQQRPTQTAWSTLFKRIIKNTNTRYALLWITGGLLFSLFGKKAMQRREKELMINDIENYLENKRNKELK